MSLFPLYEDDLCDDERTDEDEYHLGVHRLMAAMLLMKSLMLQSDDEMRVTKYMNKPFHWYESLPGLQIKKKNRIFCIKNLHGVLIQIQIWHSRVPNVSIILRVKVVRSNIP